MKRLRVGVIYGGRSSEHEVSLASAAAVISSLDRARYEPIPIRIEKDGRWTLADRPPTAISAAEVIEQARLEAARTRPGREVHLLPRPSEETMLSIDRPRPGSPVGDLAADGDRVMVTGLGLDVIFPVLHGPYGEDGTIQGLLELANVPYVGAGVLASALGMDKAMMKVAFAERGLPIVEHLVVRRPDWVAHRERTLEAVESRLRPPVFVKPANLGSSIGISKAKTREELAAAIDLAAEFDRKILVEAAVPNAREIECGVLGNDDPEASVPGEIVPSREFYDYEAKYLDAGSEARIPAPIGADMAREVQRLAIAAFKAVDAAGMARVDFLLARDTNALVVNEINTIPGFTTISMFPKLWEASGVSYSQLIDRLIQLAIEHHRTKPRPLKP